MNEIINKIAQDNNFELIQTVKIEQGVMTDKYLLKVKQSDGAEKKVILRIYPKDRESRLSFEPQVFIQAKRYGVKVPEYISSSIEKDDKSTNYILYNYLEGRTLKEAYNTLNEDSLVKIIKEIVDNLLKLAEINCERFGPLEKNLVGSFDSWKSFIEKSYNDGKNEIKNYSKNNDVKKILCDFKEYISFKNIIESDKKTLVWLDFHPENIIVNNSAEFVGFIDFEEMVSGPFETSIGYLYAREGKSDFFNRIITELNLRNFVFEQSKINSYAILRLFRIAPYLKNDLPTGKKRGSLFCVFKGLHEIYLDFEVKKTSRFWDYLFFTFGFKELGFEKQKRFTAFNLTFFSLLIIGLFVWIFTSKIDSNVHHSQYWKNEEKIELNFKKSPIWFAYEKDSLITSAYITENMKKELIELAPDSTKLDCSYFKEISVLANKSQKNDKSQIFWLIIASGIISVVGVNIRSLWDFVGNASYKYDLDIDRWWPWYFLRPTIGFLAGIVFYFLYNGGIVELNVKYNSESRLFFLLALSGLIGFGLTDFISRLRIVSKAIFGSEDSKKK